MSTVILSETKDLLFSLSSTAPALRAVLVATLVIGLAGIATTIAWRASASTRHAMWLLALGAALVGAVVSATGPVIEVETSKVIEAPGVAAFDGEFLASIGAEVTPSRNIAAPPTAQRSTVVESIRQHRNDIVVALWIIGMLMIVARCAAGHVGIARMISRSHPMDRARETLGRGAARAAGVKGTFRVLLSNEIDAPFTVGARRPVVLLPNTASTWTDERFQIVLVHELAHVARLDYIAQLVATAACAIYWFNPIVWLAASRLRAEAEYAADDRVLSAGIDGVTYASHLLELAGRRASQLSTAVAVGMARSTRLERRFQAMLDSTRARGTVPLRLQAFAGTAVMLMAVPLVGFRMVPVQPTVPPTAVTKPTLMTMAPIMVTAATVKPTPTVAAAATVVADTVIEKTLSAAAGERILIDLRTGGEIIVQAWDQSQIRMRATLSGDQSRETTVGFQRGSGGVELRSTFDQRRNNTRNSNRFELWVPRRFDVHVSSAGGGIKISNVEGKFTGNTGGGEIVIEGAKGEANLTTGGGQIHLTGSDLNGRVTTGGGQASVVGVTGNVQVSSGSGPVIRSFQSARSIGIAGNTVTSVGGGPVIVIDGQVYDGSISMTKAGGGIDLDAVPNGGVFRTGGGDISIGSSAGKLSLTTGGGDVTVAQMGGDVAVSTGAGNVQITVVNTDGTAHSVNVNSGSGRIVIDLPANIDARFDLETAYTENHRATNIDSDFTVTTTETTEWSSREGTPRRYVRATGTAGTGRGLIRIHTVNGDVVIRRR